MTRLWCFPLIVVSQLLCSLSAAAQCPGINVGYCGFSIGGQSVQRFYNYKTATDTELWGVTNDGRIVGNYNAANHNYAFLLENGNWMTFSDPNQLNTTTATGINNLEHIVGFYDGYKNDVYTSFGFLKVGDTYTTLDYPTGQSTRAFGVNDSDAIVGDYQDSQSGVTHGYVYVNGNWTIVDYPGASQTSITGINKNGDMVGFVTVNYEFFSFLYRNGQFIDISYPGSKETDVWGINDSGMVVGYQLDAQQIAHGFVWNNGQFTDIKLSKSGNYPTLPHGINHAGEMVGTVANNSY